MRKLLCLSFLLLISSLAFGQGGTTSSDIYPAVTGQNLGNPNQRWNIYAQNLDVAGSTLGGDFNVLLYGAKCDNATDDTAAFAAAIAAAKLAFGGRIYVPSVGTCLTNVVIDSVSGIELVGESHYATAANGNGARLKAADATKPVVTISATTADASNNAVKDLTLINGTVGVSVLSSGTFQAKFSTLESLSIIGPTAQGVLFTGTSANPATNSVTWKWFVRGVHVYNTTGTCFDQEGWVEQITYDDPYCGQFGVSGFKVNSVNNGAGPLSYETIINSPSIGSYSGSGTGTTAAGYDYDFTNAEGVHVINPYNDWGTANFAHFAGTIYMAEFTGPGHGGIKNSNYGFVFDTSGVYVGVHIDMTNWRNFSSHKSLTNLGTNTLIYPRLDFRGGGAGQTAEPFVVADWEGAGGAPATAWYASYLENGVLPIASVALTDISSVVNTTGGSYSSPVWLSEQNRDNGPAQIVQNQSANAAAQGLYVSLPNATANTLFNVDDKNGAGIQSLTSGFKIKQTSLIYALEEPDLLTASRTYHWPDAAGNYVIDTAAQTLTNKTISATTLALTASGTTVTTAGTAVTNGTCQAQTGVTITGVTTASVVAWSIPTALPATWQTGITVVPVVTANTVTLNLCNPTSGSITPAAQAVNIRVIQ